MNSNIKKLAKIAEANPDLRPLLMPVLREAVEKQADPAKVTFDHGWEQPLAGGTDVMKRLQDQLLIEQGNEPREKNPRLAADDIKKGDKVEWEAFGKKFKGTVKEKPKAKSVKVQKNDGRMITVDVAALRKVGSTNPRLAAVQGLQQDLIRLLQGAEGRRIARQIVASYSASVDETILVNAAADEVLRDAVAVALDPKRMGAIIAKHTIPSE